ncbi:ATP-binding cassette domain-containing protein [Nocardia sp. NPDC051321]|uniref:ATP-binding cassette domain-containing protein n=1 Tax=Nocardia sp. NPDC051321 TaxID=3364323 RepID=UPI0037AF997D
MAGVEVEGLRKVYGDTEALQGVTFSVPEGTLLGLLGPNGAGKTTAVRCLTTLARPTAGRAMVDGHDVIAEAAQVRASIALAGQHVAVDEVLTGRENLVLFSRLVGLNRQQARARAAELLSSFDLEDAADRRTKTYSGGMRRRLDLAASLVTRPNVLFFDEPTTGLDPRSRLALWDTIRRLRTDGLTIVLTTQYLEEADQLADQIVVIDKGQVIANGTAAELKKQVGGPVCTVQIADLQELDKSARALRLLADRLGVEVTVTDERAELSMPAPDGMATLRAVTDVFDQEGIEVVDVTLRRPSLDEVFLAFTGRSAAPEQA